MDTKLGHDWEAENLGARHARAEFVECGGLLNGTNHVTASRRARETLPKLLAQAKAIWPNVLHRGFRCVWLVGDSRAARTEHRKFRWVEIKCARYVLHVFAPWGSIFFFGDEKAFTFPLSSANNDNQLYGNKFYTCFSHRWDASEIIYRATRFMARCAIIGANFERSRLWTVGCTSQVNKNLNRSESINKKNLEDILQTEEKTSKEI